MLTAHFLCKLDARSCDFHFLPRFRHPVACHIFATNFPKEILSAPNFEAKFWIRPHRVSFSFIRDTATSLSRNPSYYSMGCEREGLRIEFEFVATNKGYNIEGSKVSRISRHNVRGMARANRRKRQPPPPPPLNFTRIFTWAQYFIGHLMPGHVLSLTGWAVSYESKCALKISFSSRDATDKELAGARTLYGISYVASTYLISQRVFSVFSISFFFFSLPLFSLFLSLFASNQWTIFTRCDASRISLYRREGGIAKHKRRNPLRDSHIDADIVVHSRIIAFKVPW